MFSLSSVGKMPTVQNSGGGRDGRTNGGRLTVSHCLLFTSYIETSSQRVGAMGESAGEKTIAARCAVEVGAVSLTYPFTPASSSSSEPGSDTGWSLCGILCQDAPLRLFSSWFCPYAQVRECICE